MALPLADMPELQDGWGLDTTSGCQSGHSSELGGRELCAREELEEEVGPLLPDPMAAPPTYVTFNSVGSAAAEAPSPGYITLSQLSPNKEGLESKESGSLYSSSLSTSYTRVGLNATTPGYVAWITPQPSAPDAGVKLPVTSF